MRLIDADVLKESWRNGSYWWKIVDVLLDDAPTVDAVPVVRCRDCAYVAKHTWSDGSIFCAGNKQLPNNYCSRGVRKDGAE